MITIAFVLCAVLGAAAAPQPELFRVVPATAISNDNIDAHIPADTDPRDRDIVRQVMKALPAAERQFVIWLHVPPGKEGYQELPNHGLIIMDDENVLQSNGQSARVAGAGYVLYFSGRVHLDSQVVYGSSLSTYLTTAHYRFNSKRRLLFKTLPSATISNKDIDVHIPADTDPADRRIVRQVMAALPIRMRQFIIWLHVPPGKAGYEELPHYGLIVMYYDSRVVKQIELRDVPGLYILYFDGKVQLDANIIYASTLDSYLTIVTHGFSWYYLNSPAP